MTITVRWPFKARKWPFKVVDKEWLTDAIGVEGLEKLRKLTEALSQEGPVGKAPPKLTL